MQHLPACKERAGPNEVDVMYKVASLVFIRTEVVGI